MNVAGLEPASLRNQPGWFPGDAAFPAVCGIQREADLFIYLKQLKTSKYLQLLLKSLEELNQFFEWPKK